MTQRFEKDWLGEWYVLLKERGGNDLVAFAKANMETQDTEWFEYSHSKMDGAGAFVKILRDMDYEIDSTPEGRAVKPHPFKRPGILLNTLRASKVKKINWKEENQNTETPPNTGYPWVGFTESETLKINQYAKSIKLSLNSFLIDIFSKTLLPNLIDGEFDGKWMFPVNMRGPIKRVDELSNMSSCVMIDVTHDTTAENIHAQIKTKLSQDQHWGIWWLSNIGKIVRTPGMRYLSKNSGKRSFYLGTISNMGPWSPPHDTRSSEHDNEVWVAFPPGSPNYPIGTALFTWHGKLGFGLKIHPYILSDQEKTKDYLSEIKEAILQKIN